MTQLQDFHRGVTFRKVPLFTICLRDAFCPDAEVLVTAQKGDHVRRTHVFLLRRKLIDCLVTEQVCLEPAQIESLHIVDILSVFIQADLKIV